jgi:hypothetical protein
MITIYGFSDDLVEVEGCEGAGEFSGDGNDRWQGDLVGPDVKEQLRVHCWFDDDGCWQVGAGQTIEDCQMPPWPVTITQKPHAMHDRTGQLGYSLQLNIDAPRGTRLTNVKPARDDG